MTFLERTSFPNEGDETSSRLMALMFFVESSQTVSLTASEE